jgi:hypothetical protein
MGALVYLVVCSGMNRVKVAAMRLREPKYLFGLLATITYFWFFVFGPLARGASISEHRSAIAPHLDLIVSAGGLLLMLVLLAGWFLPNKRAALRFTETEVNTLFPAPLDRRTLIHYRLLKMQIATLVTVALFTILSFVFRPDASRPMIALGWWLLLTLIQLHGLANAFARDWLLKRGGDQWKRRAAVGAVLFGALGGSLIWVWAGIGPEPKSGDIAAWVAFLRSILMEGPLYWLIAPFIVLLRPIFAESAGQFLIHALPLAAVTVLHYLWVVRTVVAFEEASVELSERTARQNDEYIARASRGFPISLRARRDAWDMGPEGRGELALAWKNLTMLGPWGRLSIAPLIIGVFALAGWLVGSHAPFLVNLMVGTIAGVLVGFTLVAGGQLLRFDLRQDLQNIDVLKTLPLSGTALVRGQVMAPVWTLFVWQCALLALIFPLMATQEGGRQILLDRGWWLAWPVFLLVAPFLNTLNFILANALFLLFPAWYQMDVRGAQGVSRIGQGIIQMILQSILILVVLVPTVAFLVIVGAAGIRIFQSPWGVFAGVLPALAMLGIAVWFFSDAVGRDFDGFDVAKELR